MITERPGRSVGTGVRTNTPLDRSYLHIRVRQGSRLGFGTSPHKPRDSLRPHDDQKCRTASRQLGWAELGSQADGCLTGAAGTHPGAAAVLRLVNGYDRRRGRLRLSIICVQPAQRDGSGRRHGESRKRPQADSTSATYKVQRRLVRYIRRKARAAIAVSWARGTGTARQHADHQQQPETTRDVTTLRHTVSCTPAKCRSRREHRRRTTPARRWSGPRSPESRRSIRSPFHWSRRRTSWCCPDVVCATVADCHYDMVVQ